MNVSDTVLKPFAKTCKKLNSQRNSEHVQIFFATRKIKRGYYRIELKLITEEPRENEWGHITEMHTSLLENEIIKSSFIVVDIMKIIKDLDTHEVFPYTPYEHDLFRTKFSDHVPVSFSYILGKDKD